MNRDTRLFKRNDMPELLRWFADMDISYLLMMSDICQRLENQGVLDDVMPISNQFVSGQVVKTATNAWIELLFSTNIELTNAIAGG